MKSGFAMLVGVGVFSLTVGVGNAMTATHHHYRHAVRPHVAQATGPVATLSQNGNNPAKRYAARQIGANATQSATLPQAGNNPAKRYSARQIAANAAQSGTLPQNGNNPAKRYKVPASR